MKIIESVKTDAAANPKKKFMLIGSVIFFLGVVVFQFIPESDMSDSANQVKTPTINDSSIAEGKNEKTGGSSTDRPASADLAKSIESMANDYVAGAIDSNEALAFLVKQESLRILSLDKTMAQYRRDISQDTFQAALQQGKLRNVGEYVQADVEGLGQRDKEENSSERYRTSSGPYYQSAQQTENKKESTAKEALSLEEFNLLSTIERNGQWFAKLSTPSGKAIDVRKGQNLGSSVVVKGVSESMVTLTNGDDIRELLIF